MRTLWYCLPEFEYPVDVPRLVRKEIMEHLRSSAGNSRFATSEVCVPLRKSALSPWPKTIESVNGEAP